MLYKDLMGLLKTESINSRRDIYIVVNYFSRHTSIDFLREKFGVLEIFTFFNKKLTTDKYFEQ